MAAKVRFARIHKKVTSTGGGDVAISGDALVGCMSVLSYPALDLIEYTLGTERARMSNVPGHIADLEDCKTHVLRSATRYCIPEPIRFAHRIAGENARSMYV
ncbi:hypothetical protein JXB22_06060 [candidate division WOR-3 bacterium]|nr:hypothetical protein [candidate division WOR-3 bacterium]